jgi:hypothetical protein
MEPDKLFGKKFRLEVDRKEENREASLPEGFLGG